MGRSVTFIHTADLHLGAPFRGLRALSDEWARRLRTAIPEAYGRVVDAAIGNAVDFVVIAGDVFDTAKPSFADFTCFFEGLRRLDAAGIPVYICTGNHDPYTSWRGDFGELPENATMFSPRQASYALYERDGEPLVMLGGRSYYNQTWPADESIVEGITRAECEATLGVSGVPFAVGVAHSGLDLDPVKAPASRSELLAAGMDYWALGHIHKRMLLPSEDDPRIVFPGDIQGRDILEAGARGCYLVTLEEGAPNRAQFVPTASIVWERLDVDVSGCATLTDVKAAVIASLFERNGRACCDDMVVRVTLTGETPLHASLSQSAVREDLRAAVNASYPTFFCDALLDETREPRDEAALRREGLFPATVLAQADRLDADPEAVRRLVERGFLERGFEPPTFRSKELAGFASSAKDLVLDLLAGSGDL